ncbi:hypothetical protein Pan153_11900 [Gimesia panareensis]|uniref:Uncharacterized protein n=1 Tax=Gimesia panareensis TaxID=2527978 RepID=A0A518FJN5_9PLAN|nr:hypothetical protein [Gimesia panareensis]QDV16559.1 hypothetical protein Pan153_11900 [Gimesia panareensis]
MPIQVSCPVCAKIYKVKEEAAGKKLRCKDCGETVSIPKLDPFEKEAGTGDDFSSLLDDAVELEAKSKTIRRVRRKPMVKAEKYKGDEDGPVTKKKENNYVEDLKATFLLLLDPSNLFIFMLLWLGMGLCFSLLPFAGTLGFIGLIIIMGWYSHYRFCVIYEAAAGEKHLPELSPEEGFFIPMIKWIFTWILVHFPAYAYAGIIFFLNPEAFAEAGLYLFRMQELSNNLPVFHLSMFIFLYCMGLFFWPILALCVAVGGIESIFRIDLMILTIVKSLPAYVFTATAMFVTAGIQLALDLADIEWGIMGLFLMRGVMIYMELVALRMIGLYYHHFKNQFAWSWG